VITYEDQMDLFRLISRNIKKGLECYAFGGTAMMFYGYKDETKDIDLLFEKDAYSEEFISALKALGFSETTPQNVYIPEKLREKDIPRMFKRDDNRFDIFSKKIFKTVISPGMKEDIFAMHEFKENKNLKVKVLRKEHIVLLKAVTERKNDFDDIRTIVEKEKTFDWQYLIDEAIWQYKNGDSWILLDMEKMIKELKQYVFIESKYLKMLYNVHGKKR
jgi:hypothetical protein